MVVIAAGCLVAVVVLALLELSCERAGRPVMEPARLHPAPTRLPLTVARHASPNPFSAWREGR